MKQEIYDYRATEQIRQIAIGIQELRCRRSVEQQRYPKGTASQINWLEESKRSAKHELLKMISDFILVREIRGGLDVEAELFLPYVRDSKIKELEDTGDFWRKSAMRSEGEIIELCKKIRLLKRPWWKKLLTKSQDKA